jgi:hypothetical protein
VILGTASGAQNVGIIGAFGVGGYIVLAGLWGSPIPADFGNDRGVIDQAPSPTSLLLITNPANSTGSLLPRFSPCRSWWSGSARRFLDQP